MDDRITAELVRKSGPVQSLTESELRLDVVPVTIDPQPKPVRVWVRFGATPVRVEGEACRWTAEACRWTAEAVAVRFTVGGTEYKVWVWASAVTPK